ncbi:hypothetical protein CEXT_700331 [Caerostris extrusa]|uniref:C2 domain-containing protein n=1 Tax=Caerostris extrusa TaxID=172846 RepID=A0AAV4RSL2_CAEEX|nr:hypothetical protein CEXT_700331 [Caerostris extrusa]
MIKATNLEPSDVTNTTDAYVVLQLGKQRLSDKENYVSKQLNPVFGKGRTQSSLIIRSPNLVTIIACDSKKICLSTWITKNNWIFSETRKPEFFRYETTITNTAFSKLMGCFIPDFPLSRLRITEKKMFRIRCQLSFGLHPARAAIRLEPGGAGRAHRGDSDRPGEPILQQAQSHLRTG